MVNGNVYTLQINPEFFYLFVLLFAVIRNPDSLLMKMRRTFLSNTTTTLVSQRLFSFLFTTFNYGFLKRFYLFIHSFNAFTSVSNGINVIHRT